MVFPASPTQVLGMEERRILVDGLWKGILHLRGRSPETQLYTLNNSEGCDITSIDP